MRTNESVKIQTYITYKSYNCIKIKGKKTIEIVQNSYIR